LWWQFTAIAASWNFGSRWRISASTRDIIASRFCRA
jgi:hypothetical protein